MGYCILFRCYNIYVLCGSVVEYIIKYKHRIVLSLLFHRAFHIYLLICTNECTIFWLKYYANISLLYDYTCFYMFRPLKVIFRELPSSSNTPTAWRSKAVHYQTRHEPHTQLICAATISTIEACNFIDFIIIQFYNNFKKSWKQLNKELSELPEDDLKGSKHVEACVVI